MLASKTDDGRVWLMVTLQAYEIARREKAEGFDPKFPGEEGGPLAAAGAKLKTAAEDAVKTVTNLAKDMKIGGEKSEEAK